MTYTLPSGRTLLETHVKVIVDRKHCILG